MAVPLRRGEGQAIKEKLLFWTWKKSSRVPTAIKLEGAGEYWVRP